jgi:predicted nucleotidyltransferase
MSQELLLKLRQLKTRYLAEGFVILGAFGSFVRNEQTPDSDLDVLYELSDSFYNAHTGWDSCARIAEIRGEMELALNIKVDMANRRALSDIGRKYILPEVLFV